MDPIVTKMFQSVPFAGMGTTLERNALVGVIRNLISESKYTVDYILDYAESVGYSRQDAEDVFKELTGLSPKLIVNNNEYYNMPVGVPNMCIAWGISKSNKEKAFYIVPFEYGYSVMEKDEVNAPVSTVICATIPEAFEELKKVAKNIQTLDKIITKKLLETENVPTTADNPHQVNLPYSASPLQVLKKNFKDKVLSVSEFERQASKLLQSKEITVDEAEDLMAWKQDLIDEDETYGNDVLELDEQWNEVQATLDFKDVYNEVLEMVAEDKDSLGTENTAKTMYNLHANLFKNVDLIEAATRLYQLLLGFTEDEILGHSKFEDKQPKQSAKKVCPNCGSDIVGYPTLSRKDNKTEICSECGQLEVLEDFHNSMNKKKSSKIQSSKKVMAYSKNQINQALEHGHAYELLTDKIITREDHELFNKAVNELLEKGRAYEGWFETDYAYELLKDKIITKQDRELFNKAVDQALKINPKRTGTLLIDKIITKEDGELFDKAVDKAIENGDGFRLLMHKIITKEDGELFDKLGDQALKESSEKIYKQLLIDKTITKEDGELFDKLVDKVSRYGYGYKLLKDKIITKEDSELFDKLVNIEKNNITKEDDEELFKEIVDKSIEDESIVKLTDLLRQKTITNKDGELFKKIFYKVLRDDYNYIYIFLRDKIITKQDGQLFKDAINKLLEHGYGYDLLTDEIITKQDGEFFNKAVDQTLDKRYDKGHYMPGKRDYIYYLLRSKTITKEDGELFDKAIDKIIETDFGGYKLLKDKIITKEDGELFDKLVNIALEHNYGTHLLKDKIITKQDREFFDKAVDQAIERGDGYQLLKYGIDVAEDKELFHKKQSSKKVTAENMTLDDIEAEDNKDEVQEEIEKIEDTPVEEIFEEKTPEQYFDKALQEDKVDTINDVVSKCIDKFSEKFKDFDKYTIKILSYNTKVLGEYTPVKEEMVKDDEINANAILQIILSIANNADETNIKKALAVFSITNGKLHWTGTVRGENDQVVAFTEEGLDALFEVEEPSEEELEDII